MEFVAPLLSAIVTFRLELENGTSVPAVLHKVMLEQPCDLGPEILQLHLLHQRMEPVNCFLTTVSSQHRRAFYELVWFGLQGRPILPELRALEGEVQRAADLQIDAFVAKLPIQVLVVVILFLVPAFLLLLLGPILNNVLKGIV